MLTHFTNGALSINSTIQPLLSYGLPKHGPGGSGPWIATIFPIHAEGFERPRVYQGDETIYNHGRHVVYSSLFRTRDEREDLTGAGSV